MKKFGEKKDIEIENMVTREQKHEFEHMLMDIEAHSDAFFKFLMRENFEHALLK